MKEYIMNEKYIEKIKNDILNEVKHTKSSDKIELHIENEELREFILNELKKEKGERE